MFETSLSTSAQNSVSNHFLRMQNPEVSQPRRHMSAAGDADGQLGKKSAIRSSSMARSAWSRFRNRHLGCLTRRPQPGKGISRRQSTAARALQGLNFISKGDGADGWAKAERRFDELTCKTGEPLPRSLFGKCIGMTEESKEFADALFEAVARRSGITGDVILDKAQLKEIWEQIVDESFDSRLQIFFDMIDRDADGTIIEAEIKEAISLSASASKLPNIQKQADEYARLIMEELDPEGHGHIRIEELEMLFLKDPNQDGGDKVVGRSLSKVLSEKHKPRQEHAWMRWWIGFRYSLVNNWRRVWVMALWIGAMAGLFGYKYVQYRGKAVFAVLGHCVCMAKGAAETLKLNMALILLPMCRNTITWLRSKRRIGMAVPFDDSVSFHQIIAVAIAIGVGIHGMCHLACDFPRLLHARPEEYKAMEQYFKRQPRSYWHFVKGWAGVTGIAMVILMAISYTLASPFFRRGKVKLPKPFDKLTGFNAFWYSHHLSLIVYLLLILHGIKLYLIHEWYKKTTWMYLAIPLALYAGERLIRVFRSNIKAVKILKGAMYPGDVLTLHLSKPPGFNYRSGQYIFVKCLAVSPFEWHPFSITTAPMDDYISVHIRIIGDWTRQLKVVFSKFLLNEKRGVLQDLSHEESNPKFPKVLIDGPYGAPTQDYKDYEIVLLVGLGIGATPMISVVKDVVNNTRKMTEDEEQEKGMEEGRRRNPKEPKNWMTGHTDFKTTKAYFYWVAREPGWFDWFKNVMKEVSEMDEKGLSVIEMHGYCSFYEEGDARPALIARLRSIKHAKDGEDIISGTRVKSHFGKPNWRDVFNNLALNHPNSKIGVFYCGQPALVKKLKHLCSQLSQEEFPTFEFHKENF